MPNVTRSFIHHVLALAIMSIYGAQVCPYLDSLSAGELVVPIAVALGLQFPLQLWLIRRWAIAGPEEQRVRRTFGVAFVLFLVSSLGLAIFNLLYHGFPLESGMKIVLGLGGLGFFAALDTALDVELNLAKFLHHSGRNLNLGDQRFTLSSKLMLFASIAVLITVSILAMVVVKDLDWMASVGRRMPLNDAKWIVLGELAFVGVVLLTLVFNAIVTFTRNLKYLFANQTTAMAATTQGDLSGFVPVLTRDELGEIARYTNQMVHGLKERDQTIRQTQDATILALACLAETRDNETGNHIRRTQNYVRALADRLSHHPRFRTQLSKEGFIDLLFKSAPLHDIGKVGIPDAILHKPGKLTNEEFDIMKTHAALGAQALENALSSLGASSFLNLGKEIAHYHHEKWDGSGYPDGLKGDDIPLSARLMAVADVYDALISKRVYKPAFPHEKAVSIIAEGRGTHFDPDIVDAMLAEESQFNEIATRFADNFETDGEGGGKPQVPTLDPATAPS